MTAPVLARLTSVLVVAAGAMTLGHVMRPFGPGMTVSEPWRPVAFLVAVAALGAWRAQRELVVRTAWADVPAPPCRTVYAAVAGASTAMLAAALGYVAVHGLGR